ncbi:hypothetical protein HMPREF0044_0578 [Gleimia coleocanis DSM 15436]|uniref:Uncharacterized protein n=1 Tax=Gleimia coleocanis DSM 15436 TaxID=525245 RepID=C0VZI8_9ACTO|nr:hypothetical protein [Gleimia coleocanis]EEH64107.1 hypothetical protein HMPREF0044_0578 [Gleimia coleocanis DSM 15436]
MTEKDFSTTSTAPAFSPEVTGEDATQPLTMQLPLPAETATDELKEPKRGTNFGLLAWAFIVFSIGIGLWLIPFRAAFDPVRLTITAFATIGILLLVTAVMMAISEHKQRK